MEKYEVSFESHSVRSMISELEGKLSLEDSSLLPRAALKMIFFSNVGSFRDLGNVGAHQADQTDLGAAVLDSKLNTTERELFKDIFVFIFGVTPSL